MKLNLQSLKDDSAAWAQAGVTLPKFDPAETAAYTRESPVWVHFGAGNIFRGFIAALQNTLLNENLVRSGIIAADTFDYDIIDKIYAPYDNLTLLAGLCTDGSVQKSVIASVTEGLRANVNDPHFARLQEIFRSPSLQFVSFTITEKGYALFGGDGSFLPYVVKDIEQGPSVAVNAMPLLTALVYERYKAGATPVALVSMDNCSHNGAKLKEAVLTVAGEWQTRGFVEAGFLDYLNDNTKVSFPWSMIDKITPRPDESVENGLSELGIENMSPIITSKNTYIAPFVNAEIPQYLVVEDDFANGRPPLEKAGVYFADRETVNRAERMKVTTCLNPLHTGLAVFGCLLSYTRIYEEMRNPDLAALASGIGYKEGLPVVTDPGILSPADFINEVIGTRLPNPFIPDAPQRIATDTSQKMAIRFGETLKAYADPANNLDIGSLKFIPLAIAGWFRYLIAVDDKGVPFEVSPDPLLGELSAALTGVVWNDPASYKGQLQPVLARADLFGLDLMKCGIGVKIEKLFVKLLGGAGSVASVLHEIAA